jgi:catechol 2,3-dioxygenase-like lactoylglutathione lyase family enzyme
VYPRAFSHIGITVTDLDKAVAWYQEILGACVLMKPTVIREYDSLIGRLCTDIFGKGLPERPHRAPGHSRRRRS